MRLRYPVYEYGVWRWAANDEVIAPCGTHECVGHETAAQACAHHAAYFCENTTFNVEVVSDTLQKCFNCSSLTNQRAAYVNCPYELSLFICKRCDPASILRTEHFRMRGIVPFVGVMLRDYRKPDYYGATTLRNKRLNAVRAPEVYEDASRLHNQRP